MGKRVHVSGFSIAGYFSFARSIATSSCFWLRYPLSTTILASLAHRLCVASALSLSLRFQGCRLPTGTTLPATLTVNRFIYPSAFAYKWSPKIGPSVKGKRSEISSRSWKTRRRGKFVWLARSSSFLLSRSSFSRKLQGYGY